MMATTLAPIAGRQFAPATATGGFPSDVAAPNNFDALRFLLAALVVYSHSFPLTRGLGGGDPLAGLTRGQIDSGSVAVDLFFALSGFLIAASWERGRSWGSFLQKRCRRIFPGLAGAALFCVTCAGPLGGADLATYFHQRDIYTFLRVALLHGGMEHHLPGVFVHNPVPAEVDGSLWTIEYEFGCYVLLMALGLLGLLRRRAVILLLLGICWVLAAGCRWEPGVTVPWFGSLAPSPRLALFFLAGTAFYLWRTQMPRSRPLLAACVCLLLLGSRTGTLAWALPLVAYVAFYLAYTPRLRLHGFARHGDFSYGVYLYAFPVQQILVFRSHGHLGPLPLFLLALPVACALAVVSWYAIEGPCLRARGR